MAISGVAGFYTILAGYSADLSHFPDRPGVFPRILTGKEFNPCGE
jgi:hypothetical protein